MGANSNAKLRPVRQIEIIIFIELFCKMSFSCIFLQHIYPAPDGRLVTSPCTKLPLTSIDVQKVWSTDLSSLIISYIRFFLTIFNKNRPNPFRFEIKVVNLQSKSHKWRLLQKMISHYHPVHGAFNGKKDDVYTQFSHSGHCAKSGRRLIIKP